MVPDGEIDRTTEDTGRHEYVGFVGGDGLSVIVGAPTMDVSAFDERARVPGARFHVERSVGELHSTRRLEDGPAAAAELAVLVVSPALDRTVLEERARHLGSGGHFHRGLRQRDLSLADHAAPSITELTVSVRAPARDGSIRAEAADERDAGGDVDTRRGRRNDGRKVVGERKRSQP